MPHAASGTEMNWRAVEQLNRRAIPRHAPLLIALIEKPKQLSEKRKAKKEKLKFAAQQHS